MSGQKNKAESKSRSVCIISTVHSSCDQRIFHKQAKTLANQGWDVSFIVHNSGSGVRDDIEIISLGEVDSRPQRWAHLPQAFVKAVETGADIYHLHDPELLPVGYALKCRTNSAIIFDMHEDFLGNTTAYQRDWIPSGFKSVILKTLPAAFSWFFRRVDAVITTTQSVANQADKLGANQTALVRNFPKTKDLSVGSNAIEKDHEHQLVYVGGLTNKRGLMWMLKTIRKLQQTLDIGLWLIGEFHDDTEELEALRYIHDNELNVRLLGYIEYNNMFPFLSTADLGLVLPDRALYQNNIPTKLFEYMYAEIPYVAVDAQMTRAYTDSEYGLLVPEHDVENTSKIIESLLTNRERLSKMGAIGKKRVEEEYNWERESQELLTLYDSLITPIDD